jgi:hypothetical protein
MVKDNRDLSNRDSSLSKKGAKGKYNSSNPVIVNLVYDVKRQVRGTMVATKFTVERGWVERREVIQVTFLGNDNLSSFTTLYPLEIAKYLAPAFMVVTEGSATSNETKLNW